MERVLRPDADWEALRALDGAISQQAFEAAMDQVYAPKADWRRWIRVEESGAWVASPEESEGGVFLRFSDGGVSANGAAGSGLAGLRIAIDAGHLGGEWGPMEHRSFAVLGAPVLQEGDLTLAVASRLQQRLLELGAEVLLLRDAPGPVTKLRPEDFLEEAIARHPGEATEEIERRRRSTANLLFYRSAEILARADRLREWGNADLALALHVNGSGKPDPAAAELHTVNDAHILINGCYLEEELALPHQRYEMLLRLLKGYHEVELALGEAMASAMRDATGLPAYLYSGDNAARIGDDDYLWVRNLMAGRVYDCPVLFLEPWQANSVAVYEWAAAGDYDGLREFGGVERASLPVVYSAFVVEGLQRYFGR